MVRLLPGGGGLQEDKKRANPAVEIIVKNFLKFFKYIIIYKIRKILEIYKMQPGRSNLIKTNIIRLHE
jgi:hypothetical protein